MNDSYLNTFGKLFFNIDENDEVKEIIEQASHVLASLITKFGEVWLWIPTLPYAKDYQ